MKKILRKILLASGITFTLCASAYNLPDIGSSTGGTLSSVQEAELGKQFMRMVRQHLPLLNDPIVVNYIQTLGHRLAIHSNDPRQHFYFFVVRDNQINAFSGPDGYIGVNTGLILIAQSEGELAAVMAHEISHVTQRHIARMIGQQKQLQWANIAALAGAIALGASGNGQAGASLATAASAGAIQTDLNFSRGYEREADEVGMQTLARSGYSPTYMPAFFARMQQQAKLNDSENVPEILLTHPLTTSRLADAENRSQFFKIKNPRPNNPVFYLIQSRILVDVTTDPIGLAERLQNKIAHAKNPSPALYYAYALALAKANKLQQAKTVIDQLVAKNPQQTLFKLAQANILQAQQQTTAALNIMQKLYNQTPDYVTTLNYARILMLNQQSKLAAQIMEKQEYKFKQDEYFLTNLSQAQGKAGELAQAYETRAKLFLLNNDPDSAIIQLQQALKFTQDRYLRARIQQEIKQVELQK